MVYEKFNSLPAPPYAFGYVLLDGADTALGGFFKGIDLAGPGRGGRESQDRHAGDRRTSPSSARARCWISGSSCSRTDWGGAAVVVYPTG